MSENDLPFAEDESEPLDVPLADPDAVAEADEDDDAPGTGDGSRLAADDPNRTW